MFVIEEVFRSMDKASKKRMLEDILVCIIKNTKNREEPNSANCATELNSIAK